MKFVENMNRVKEDVMGLGRDLAKQGRNVFDSAMEKGKGLAEQGKLSLDNQKQAQTILDAQLQIGTYVSDNALLADDPFVLNQMSVIAAAKEAQERNNNRIAELKATETKQEAVQEPVEEKAPVHVCELRFCPDCGTQVRTDAVFCHACGKRL